MRNHIEAATRCGMPAVGFLRTANAAVSAYKASPAVAAFSTLVDDTSNGAQGARTAWGPPV